MEPLSISSRAARHQQWLERVDAALNAYGMAAAAELSLKALAEGIEDPVLLNLAASAYYGEGQFEEATKLLSRARALAPDDPHLLNSLGLCLKALGQADAALEAFEKALLLDPRMVAAHFNRGTVLEERDDVKAARSSYERAAALDPNYAEPLASLAWLDAQAGDVVSARTHGERALALSPSNVLARMALASASLQRKDLAGAGALLSRLSRDPALSAVNRSIVLGLIGDLLDLEDRPAEAFAAYKLSNEELKALNGARFERPGKELALEQVRRLIAWFEADGRERRRQMPSAPAPAGAPREHIFLVGFPRSGTTLLENVLASHREVISLEEKDCLAPASSVYLDSDAGLERLAAIDPAEAARERDSYWALVRSFGIEPAGRVFIDKLPLASVQLPIIAKLFPTARVLFALRDPRDVVLSCFRRRFAMNPSMYQLLTLDGAAAYYDAVMELSALYRNVLAVPQHIVRYESLVEDFEGTVRDACGFLGLEWDAGMVDFAARAGSRGIATPSAAQVARGLNREGQGTWRRYREQMTPVLPLLEPWVRRFGYEPVD